MNLFLRLESVRKPFLYVFRHEYERCTLDLSGMALPVILAFLYPYCRYTKKKKNQNLVLYLHVLEYIHAKFFKNTLRYTNKQNTLRYTNKNFYKNTLRYTNKIKKKVHWDTQTIRCMYTKNVEQNKWKGIYN